MRKQTIYSTLLATSLCFTSSASYGAGTDVFQPFNATYKVVSEGSISMTGESQRSLTQKDGNWTLSSSASALFATIEESSQFSLNQQQIQPLIYTYNRKVLGKTRKANLSFDWNTNRVENNVNDKPWSMDISKGVLDKLSYQLQLQADVASGLTDLNYKVADGGRLKEYSFAVTGKETISTPAGDFESIRVERKYDTDKGRSTQIWFAPALNYQLIQLRRVEKKNKMFSLVLKSIDK